MTTQMRKYTIKKGKMDEFVTAWMDNVYPLRLKHGFTVDYAGILEDSDDFVCLISTAGDRADWDAREAAYYDSEEHARLEPKLAPHITGGETWFVNSVIPPS